MTHVSMNPPCPNSLLQGQNQLFNVPIHKDPPTLFNLIEGNFRDNHHYQGDNKMAFHEDGSSSSSSSNHEYKNSSSRDTNLSSTLSNNNTHDHGCVKMMKKMSSSDAATSTNEKAIINTTFTTTPRYQNLRYNQTSPCTNNNKTTTIRVCFDCNTTTTPLWRSGPMGPKTLCNACGIRQRKARRALAEATSGLVTTKTRVHNKEKKTRVKNFTKFKNKNESSIPTITTSSSQDVRKFENYALNLRNNFDFEDEFVSDDVAQAALLLMNLSCDYFRS